MHYLNEKHLLKGAGSFLIPLLDVRELPDFWMYMDRKGEAKFSRTGSPLQIFHGWRPVTFDVDSTCKNISYVQSKPRGK
jgi:hypothetical protein